MCRNIRIKMAGQHKICTQCILELVVRIDKRDKGSKVNCPLSAFEIWAPLHNKPEGKHENTLYFHTETNPPPHFQFYFQKYQNMYCKRMPNISLVSRPRGLGTRLAIDNVLGSKNFVMFLGFLLPSMEHDAMILATRITYLSSVSQKRSMEALSKCLFVLLICRNTCTNIHRVTTAFDY